MQDRFGSQNRYKLAALGHFWKFKSRKLAPRLRARAIWKSKSFKALLEVELRKICTTPARESDLEVKTVKKSQLRALLEVDVAKACTRLWHEIGLEVKIVEAPGSRTTFWGSTSVSRGRRGEFDTASTKKSLKRIVILRSSVWLTYHFSGKSRRTASVSQLVS